MPSPEPRKPANWSPAEIEIECARARGDFRLRRLDAPKIDYENEINSRKRLNKEVVKNANGWTSNFGKLVIAGAVLRGVFKPQYVISAQETPVAIFWGHRLSDLAAFVRAART